MWVLIFASIFQLIGIAVYGGKGIGNYSFYEPGYSIIIAGIALGFNLICTSLFFVDIMKNEKKISKY